jgi:hypothetical protein
MSISAASRRRRRRRSSASGSLAPAQPAARTRRIAGQRPGPIGEPTTPAQTCRWVERARSVAEPSIDRALTLGADLVPGLGEAQFKHLEQRYAKSLAEMRTDYLQAARGTAEGVDQAGLGARRVDVRPARRRAAQADRRGIAASPFDPEAWLQERERRQADIVQTLRRLVAERPTGPHQAAMRAQAERALERSPDPDYRAYQQRLCEFNCALAAADAQQHHPGAAQARAGQAQGLGGRPAVACRRRRGSDSLVGARARSHRRGPLQPSPAGVGAKPGNPVSAAENIAPSITASARDPPSLRTGLEQRLAAGAVADQHRHLAVVAGTSRAAGRSPSRARRQGPWRQ